MLKSSVMVLPPTGNSARHSDGSLTDAEDIFITINNEDEAEFVAIQPPRALINNESFQKEKQISVDPISLKGSTMRQASFRLVSPPFNNPSSLNPSVPLPPSKLKFVSGSLPSSASSSPQKSSNLLKKIWKNQNDNEGPQPRRSNLSRVSSAMDDTHIAMREVGKRRSRSMGERRSSFAMDDFDLWLEKPDKLKVAINQHQHQQQETKQVMMNRKHSKPPLGPSSNEYRMKKSKSRDQKFPDQDGFKCGKLCLFLPRGKGKPVRSPSTASTATQVSGVSEGPVISRTVSLERFDCGSWSSSIGLDGKEGESTNLFFDLPLELLRCSVSDMQSPVTAAFVFDDESGEGETSNVNTIEDFEVFLEAQSI